MALSLALVSSSMCHGGYQKVFSHQSLELDCKMHFSIYIPPTPSGTEKFPVLIWLSGLTCNEKNFIEKSGFQAHAAEYKLIVVGPDTSPRGCNIEGEDESWDFGTGAGFYVDATEPKWKNNYRMYSYITKELQKLIDTEFPTTGATSISGHSMGGHGALICALKNPHFYKSVSAFAPICNPINCKWGQKCFKNYLGSNTKDWEEYDATCLAKSYNGNFLEILIDQGSEDPFLQDEQLLPHKFIEATQSHKKLSVQFRKQKNYDHSYYFISSFIRDHISFHAERLNLWTSGSV